MIFSGGLHEQVLDGSKTVTRRPVRADQPCPYRVGRDYAVQPGRGKHSLGRIRVTHVCEQELGAITDLDVVLEGFPDFKAFWEKWESLYGAVDWSQPVWRIEFEVIEAAS